MIERRSPIIPASQRPGWKHFPVEGSGPSMWKRWANALRAPRFRGSAIEPLRVSPLSGFNRISRGDR